MLGERWMQGAVPASYASKTLGTFGKKIRAERERISSGKLPPGVREFLAAHFDSTAGATDSLLAVVDRGDKRGAADFVSLLSAQARAADSVGESLGTK
jgi:hypothetical protein